MWHTYHKWYFLSVRRPPVGLVPESGAPSSVTCRWVVAGGDKRRFYIGDIFNLIYNSIPPRHHLGSGSDDGAGYYPILYLQRN